MNSFMAEGVFQSTYKFTGSHGWVIRLPGSLDEGRANDDAIGDLSHCGGLIWR